MLRVAKLNAITLTLIRLTYSYIINNYSDMFNAKSYNLCAIDRFIANKCIPFTSIIDVKTNSFLLLLL